VASSRVGATISINGSARTPSLTESQSLVILGRFAASFLAFPISFDNVGIKKAAVFPEPAYIGQLSNRIFGSRLKHTCLSYSNYVTAHQNGWQTVGLDRCGNLVATQLNVLQHDRMQPSVLELKITVSCVGSGEVMDITVATGLIFASLSTVTAIPVSLNGYVSFWDLLVFEYNMNISTCQIQFQIPSYSDLEKAFFLVLCAPVPRHHIPLSTHT